MSSSKATGSKSAGSRKSRPKSNGAKQRSAAVKVATRSATKLATTKQAKIAESSATATDGVSAQMIATAAAMEKALTAGALETLPNESLQKLIAAVVKVYSAKREAGDHFLPLNAAGRVTPTDIMLTSSQLLRSGNLQVFELGMWQSWTGN